MNKHTATHNGFTYKRNSAGRTYSHVVLVRNSRAEGRRECERYARQGFAENRAFYEAFVDGTSKHLSKGTWESDEQHAERVAKDVARAAAFLEGGVEGHVSRALAHFDARKPGTLEADGDTWHTVAGWCGRRDLAVRLAAKYCARAVIVEATIK